MLTLELTDSVLVFASYETETVVVIFSLNEYAKNSLKPFQVLSDELNYGLELTALVPIQNATYVYQYLIDE